MGICPSLYTYNRYIIGTCNINTCIYLCMYTYYVLKYCLRSLNLRLDCLRSSVNYQYK